MGPELLPEYSCGPPFPESPGRSTPRGMLDDLAATSAPPRCITARRIDRAAAEVDAPVRRGCAKARAPDPREPGGVAIDRACPGGMLEESTRGRSIGTGIVGQPRSHVKHL